jgi:uncharacterized protein YbjT (DUF2867 family)
MEDARHPAPGPDGRILVLGGTGFIGRRLVRALAERNVPFRLLARDAEKARRVLPEGADAEVAAGDLVTGEGMGDALQGIHTAFYLVHSMGGRTLTTTREFAARDEKAAGGFVREADEAGLGRVIYLGGLGEESDDLSEHLRSRAQVGRILGTGSAKATVLRAAIIIGAGGASFEMLRFLTERLPVMLCPRWIDTRIQPIAVDDVIAYLTGCLATPATAGETFDIGGPDVLTYRQMIHLYAEARGLARRVIFTAPVLTPLLSAYWVDLVTPIPSGVAHPLIEGLRNEVICHDTRIEGLIPIEKTPFIEAVRRAIREETTGPGVTGF